MNQRVELFLGIIAFASLATALVQIGVLVVAGRLARRVDRLLVRVEQEIQPVLGHVQAIARDASRAASLTVGQVERVDRLFADVEGRVGQTLNNVQQALVTPAREGAAVLAGLRAALSALRDPRASSRVRSRAEDDEALFI